DSEKGIAIERYGVFDRIADAILSGRAKEVYPDYSEEDSIRFAKAVKSIDDEDQEK
ncbi:MAG: AbrB family transcriptional regulator, partial [Thermotogaceae bacterium]|nr:AbrB family transcriptional regulator [Thermotogaceae bacterium]